MANSHMYNKLYAAAQLTASEDEFRIRCRDAHESKTITDEEYKKLLEFRKEIHGSQAGHRKSTDIEV